MNDQLIEELLNEDESSSLDFKRDQYPFDKATDDEWDDRYRYVIELGRTLPPLPESAHNDANKVQGCASQVMALFMANPTAQLLTF